MPEKRMLVVQAELVKKIDENRGDMTQSAFIEFLLDSQLKQGAEAPDEKKYATKEELRLFEEDIKQFLKNFLDFFVSYWLESGKGSIKTTERPYGEFLAQLESLKQQATASEADFERALSQSAKQTNPVIIEEGDKIIPSTDLEVSPEVTRGITAEAPEQTQAMDQSDTSELEKKAPVSTESQETTDYEIAAELEILPPVDMRKITRIMIYLDRLPEVETTELVPLTDKPLIIVLLREPMHLIEILKTLPEVSQAQEVTEGKLRKIQMTLSGNSVLDEAKEGLGSGASRDLSS